MTHHVCAGFVRAVFSLARKAKLQKCGTERSKEDQKKRENPAASTIAVVAIATAAEPESHVCKKRDRTRKGCRDGADENVVVPHMRKFVRNHALEFVVVHQFQESLRHRDRSVTRIA